MGAGPAPDGRWRVPPMAVTAPAPAAHRVPGHRSAVWAGRHRLNGMQCAIVRRDTHASRGGAHACRSSHAGPDRLILESLAGAAAHPDADSWGAEDIDDVDYLYREDTVLVRERDAGRVIEALVEILYGEGGEEAAQGEERPPPLGGEDSPDALIVRGVLSPRGSSASRGRPACERSRRSSTCSTRLGCAVWPGSTPSSTCARTPARRRSRSRCRRAPWTPSRPRPGRSLLPSGRLRPPAGMRR